MPLIIPDDLPAKKFLEKEQIFTMNEARALHQDIRPIYVAILNLMPNKKETELQLMKMLSNTALQVNVDLIKTESYNPKNTDSEHLDKFYTTFSQIKEKKYDAMIITGAPVEKMDFEDVDYWEELCDILDYAKENVYSTMFICWAAQAALYHYYKIAKVNVNKKIFGVFDYETEKQNVLIKGFDSVFYMPQSRFSLIRKEDVKRFDSLDVLASRDDNGVNIVTTKDNRFVFVSGHWEYSQDTLLKEFLRDKEKNTCFPLPTNYFKDGNIENNPLVRWRAHGNLFFSNWLNYCVYQQTPYDIETITEKVVAKFGGSSLSDSNQFNKVKGIVFSTKDRNIIVVSAPGKRFPDDLKITDALLYFASFKKRGDKKNADIQKAFIESRFVEIAKDLGLLNVVEKTIKRVISSIEKTDSLDFIVTRGEYLNALMLSHYLDYEFCDSVDIIYFKYNGELDKYKTYKSIRARLNPLKCYVVPGFYGVDKGHGIRAFSRGGSDITGAIIASALKCKSYENWTDVDGVMTNDPNISPQAKKIDYLTYEELMDITNKGANVYHPGAISLLKDYGIPINIRNTNKPLDTGTLIGDDK